MGVAELLGLIASILSLAGFAWAVVRRAHKKGKYLFGRLVAKHTAPIAAQQMRSILTEELAPLVKQLSPNSGTSAVDRLARIDQWREDFATSVNAQFAVIGQHLAAQDETMLRHLENHAAKK